MNLNRKTFIKNLLCVVCFTSIFSVAYATKPLPNEKTQNLFEEKQQTRAFARVVGEKNTNNGENTRYASLFYTDAFTRLDFLRDTLLNPPPMLARFQSLADKNVKLLVLVRGKGLHLGIH